MQPDAQAVAGAPAQVLGRGARSLTARLTLVAALGALPVLISAGASLLWLFYERIESKFDAFLAAYQQQLIAGAELNAAGELRLSAQPADPHFALPFSGWYWQVSAGERTLAQSPSESSFRASWKSAVCRPVAGLRRLADLALRGRGRLDRPR